MAESRAEGDGYVLIENHCPICVAAKACQGFCRVELDTFRDVLGPDVSVERTEHIVAGGRRCVYRITPKRPPQEEPRPRAGRRGEPATDRKVRGRRGPRAAARFAPVCS
jgi:hypothetical protein